VACCAEIAGAAPALPFYFYDIPILTGVQFSMPIPDRRAGTHPNARRPQVHER